MKKMYKFYALIATSLAFSYTSFAQTKAERTIKQILPLSPAFSIDHSEAINLGKSSRSAAPGDTIWKEDFAGPGLPAGWTVSGPDSLTWRRTTKLVSTGCYASASSAIQSTTAANGILLFDADSANKWQAPNNGNCTGVVMTAKVGSITTGSIDLSTYSDVTLKMQHRFRLCCSVANTGLTVSVSGDGGTTWTDYDVREGVAINQTPIENAKRYAVNISGAAGGKANVKLKFTFRSTSGAYFWSLDDIALVKVPDNDLKLAKDFTDFYYKNGGFYTQTPFKQIGNLTFRAAITNEGVLPQTNVKLNVSIVRDNTTNVYNQTSATKPTLAKLAKDTLLVNATPFKPNATGSYKITYRLQQTETDADSSNNKVERTIMVTDTVYARDGGVSMGSTGTSNYVGGNVDNAVMGNVYEMNADGEASSVTAWIHSNSDTAAIRAEVYKITYSGDFVGPIIVSEVYDIEGPTTKGKFVTLALKRDGASEMLMKDSTYIAAINNLGGSTKDVFFGNDLATPQPDAIAFIKTTDWGWISSLPMIRLNLRKYNVGIKEEKAAAISLGQNVPNPHNGTTNISYFLSNGTNVSLEVYDVAGKKLLTVNEGKKPAGTHVITLNEKLNAGVYFYTLVAGNNRITKRMTVVE